MPKKPEVLMVLGYPASGKSELAKRSGFLHLNRDAAGGAVIDLLPKMVAALKSGKDVVLDNLFATRLSRQPFIEAAKKLGAIVNCAWMQTSLEDSQINALSRMWQRHGMLFLDPESLKGNTGLNYDPNMFPVAVLFKYRKEFEKPTLAEGFDAILPEPFVRRKDPSYKNKALILDYDDTLRCVTPGAEFKFPTKPEEISILPGRQKVLSKFAADGYLLLGVSNQSGVSKGSLTEAEARACFEATNKKLGFEIDYQFCPHSVPPSCYCRKPQSGLGVLLIEKYKLDPAQCIYVGDQTTDKTFAARLGFQFIDQAKFFR